MSRIHEISESLQALSEELGDLAIERLREAIESGDQSAAAEEKLITRARRSIDKAAHLLDPQSPHG